MLVGVAERAALPPAERMIGHRHRDRHIDADHTDIDPRCKFARGMAIAGEDRDAIAILMLARQRQRLLKIGGADHLQHGAENLFLIAFHVGGDAVEQSRPDEETLLMALQFEAAAIDHQFGTFIDAGLDPALNLGLVRTADHRAVMGIGIGRNADAQRLDRRDQLGAQAVGGLVADRDNDRQGHAAFTRRAEGRARQIIDHLIEIGVGHDDAMVLGPAHRLHPLAVGDAAIVDIMGDVGRPDEADRTDGRMIEDGIDHRLVTMHHLTDAGGEAGLKEQFGEPHRH